MLSLPQGEPRAWMMTLAYGCRTTAVGSQTKDTAQLPPTTTNARHQLDLYYGNMLPQGVGLFEAGVPEDATDPLDFVMRVNRQIFVKALLTGKSRRSDFANAILKSGQLKRHAELVAFGTWMVCDGMRGAKKHPGPVPDVRKLFKVTACGFAALQDPDRKSKNPGRKGERVTPKDIVKFWEKCFGGAQATSAYSSNLRSLRMILRDYLACLAAGTITFNGQRVTASPEMARLAKAIKKPRTPRAGTATSAATHSAGGIPALPGAPPGGSTVLVAGTASPFVVPAAFEIPLVYSSPVEEARYRGAVSLPDETPSLRYRVEPVRATSAGAAVRSDLAGRVVFTPEHPLAGAVTIRALIDKIALTVSTTRPTTNQVLQTEIRSGEANVHVEDRTKLGSPEDHHACLPKIEDRKSVV